MSTQGRGGMAIRRSFAEELAREQVMGEMLLATRGYGDIEIKVLGPRTLVASSHKVVNGERVVASALGIDELDATRKLVKVVMRP